MVEWEWREGLLGWILNDGSDLYKSCPWVLKQSHVPVVIHPPIYTQKRFTYSWVSDMGVVLKILWVLFSSEGWRRKWEMKYRLGMWTEFRADSWYSEVQAEGRWRWRVYAWKPKEISLLNLYFPCVVNVIV